jgi:ABC-type transport system involved in cytochrome c biogenesis permease component
MTFLPIVERELRVTARRPVTYWARFGIALVVMVVFVWMLRHSGNQGRTMFGHDLFGVLTTFAFGYALLVGIFFTADCLSSEKREGTLGLLFLTDLRSYDVVAGKVFASSVVTFYALFALFPIIALPMLIGGVTGGELARMVLVLCTTAMFSLAIGALVSALNSEDWQAMSGTFVVLFVITGVLPALWATFFARRPDSWIDGVFLYPGPAYAFGTSFDSSYASTGGPLNFWSSICTILTITLVAFIVACVVLPSSWRKNGRQRNQKLDYYSDSVRRGRFLKQNSFLWLSLRLRGRLRWLAIVGALAGVFWAFFFVRDLATKGLNDNYWVCFYGTFVAFAVFKFVVAVVACRRFHDDRRSGGLELILATPISIEEVLHGQETGMWRLFRIPLFVLAGMNVLLLGEAIRVEGFDDFVPVLGLFTAGGIVTLFTDFHWIVRMGMLQGMIRRKFNIAVLMIVAQVLVAPWVVGFALFLAFVASGGSSENNFIIFGFLYFTLCSMVAAGIAQRARDRLLFDFRELAAGAVNSRNSFSSAVVSPQNSTST